MRSSVSQALAAIIAIGCAAASSCTPGDAGTGPGPGSGKGGRMAFVRRPGSVNQIYLMDVDASGVGSNPTRLTGDGDPENYPSWSPDGKRLL